MLTKEYYIAIKGNEVHTYMHLFTHTHIYIKMAKGLKTLLS